MQPRNFAHPPPDSIAHNRAAKFNAERVNANPALKARRMSYIRAGRYGRSEEVAEVVAFLASMKGTYMLGENVVIDGGYVVH